MTDSWQKFTDTHPLARIEGAYTVTPNDGVDLTIVPRAIHIGTGGGALKVTFVNGDVVTYANIEAGRHPLGVKRIWATGTTVTQITAEY